MTEMCSNPLCITCLHGRTQPSQYRPHTLTPDCWCQAHKDEYVSAGALLASPKRCWLEKDYAHLLTTTGG